MSGGEDWLFAPVMAGKLSAESLFNGNVGMYEISLINEALAVMHENEYRASKQKP